MIGIPTQDQPAPGLRAIWNDCLRYWEPRRVVYNLVLTAVVLSQVTRLQAWPYLVSFHGALGLIICCALANLCYCSAYVVDLGLQLSDYRESWLRSRWGLYFAGCILGAALTSATITFAAQRFP